MQKIIFENIHFILLFLSFTATTYTPPWTSSSMEFFAFLATLSLTFSIKNKNQKLFFNEITCFLILILLFSIVFFLKNSFYPVENLSMLLLYGIFLLIYNKSVAIKVNDFYEKTLIIVFSAGLFNCFVILSQNYEAFSSDLGIWVADYNQDHGRPYGNFGQPNLAATLILTCISIAIFLRKNNHISTFSLLIIAIFFSHVLAYPSSKTSFLALFLLSCSAFLLKEKIDFLIFTTSSFVVLISKLLITSSRDISSVDISTGRFEIWKMMWEALLQSPWLGYGFLGTKSAHFEIRELDLAPREQVIGSAHNLFIDFLIWFGIFPGILLVLFFILIAYRFIKNNIKTPENIYLILPIAIHAQLEYPLQYANFLFLFVFLYTLGSKKINPIEIKSNVLNYTLIASGAALLIAVSSEYYILSNRYTDLRFYNSNFSNSKKPAPHEFKLLDLTGAQYNFFLKDRIETKNDYEHLKSITPYTPALKNYMLIIYYLKENNYPREEIDYWLIKARASFSEIDFKSLEKIYFK